VEPQIGSEILNALSELGPWGAMGLFILWQMARDKKRNGGLNGKELKAISSLQESQSELLNHIESEGSIRFQRFLSGDDVWKKSAEEHRAKISDRVDKSHRRIDVQKERMDMLLTEHKMHHPESTVP